jgi:hypothetical protein
MENMLIHQLLVHSTSYVHKPSTKHYLHCQNRIKWFTGLADISVFLSYKQFNFVFYCRPFYLLIRFKSSKKNMLKLGKMIHLYWIFRLCSLLVSRAEHNALISECLSFLSLRATSFHSGLSSRCTLSEGQKKFFQEETVLSFQNITLYYEY